VLALLNHHWQWLQWHPAVQVRTQEHILHGKVTQNHCKEQYTQTTNMVVVMTFLTGALITDAGMAVKKYQRWEAVLRNQYA